MQLHIKVQPDRTNGAGVGGAKLILEPSDSPALIELRWSPSRYDEPPYNLLSLMPVKMAPAELPTHPGTVQQMWDRSQAMVCVELAPNPGNIWQVSATNMGLCKLGSNQHGHPEWDFGLRVWELTVTDVQRLEQEVRKCLLP